MLCRVIGDARQLFLASHDRPAWAFLGPETRGENKPMLMPGNVNAATVAMPISASDFPTTCRTTVNSPQFLRLGGV